MGDKFDKKEAKALLDKLKKKIEEEGADDWKTNSGGFETEIKTNVGEYSVIVSRGASGYMGFAPPGATQYYFVDIGRKADRVYDLIRAKKANKDVRNLIEAL